MVDTRFDKLISLFGENNIVGRVADVREFDHLPKIIVMNGSLLVLKFTNSTRVRHTHPVDCAVSFPHTLNQIQDNLIPDFQPVARACERNGIGP